MSNSDNYRDSIDKNRVTPEVERIELISKRYSILRTLFQYEEFTLSEIAERSETDIGNLSRYISDLEEKGLIKSRSKKREKGKPYRLISLTDLSRRILSVIINEIGDKKKPSQFPDPEYLSECLELLENSDPEVQRVISDEIALLCRNYEVPVESDLIKFLEENLLNVHYRPVLFNLLQALISITKNSEEGVKGKIKSMLKKQLEEIALIYEDETNKDKVRYHALKALAELAQDEDNYNLLTKIYNKLLGEDSSITSNVRDLILSKYPEKRSEMRLYLIKKFKDSDNETRSRIEIELTQLR